MIFDQAYFGGSRTHNCLASSINNERLLSTLIGFTDKPHTLNKIEPNYFGTRIEDYYVFTKTIPIENPERGGIVFSHCLIIPIDNVEYIEDLQKIFENLLNEPRYVTNINKIEINDIEFSCTNIEESNYVVQNVIKGILDNKKPVICSYELFNNSICAIWQSIPKRMRNTFSFRLSGNQNDLPEQIPTLIYTPQENKIRWQNTSFVLIENNSVSGSLSLAESYLIYNINNEFSSFIEQYDIEIQQLIDYRKVEGIFDYYRKWTNSKDIQELNKVIRISTKLYPKTEMGFKLKEEIFNLFYTEILNSSCEIIGQIRDIDFKVLDNGLETINKTMNKWLNNFQKKWKDYPIEQIAELLLIFKDENNPVWWQANIETFLRNSEIDFLFHWRLWENNPIFISLSDKCINLEEEIIIKNINSTLAKNLLKSLIDFSKIKKWKKVHAVCSGYYYNKANESIVEHLKIINNDYESFGFLIQIIGNSEFVTFSKNSDNVNLHKISGKLIAGDFDLLLPNRIDNINWQSIWYYSLLITKDCSKGFTNPQNLIFTFFDIILSNSDYNTDLLSFIANTDFGNVLFYHQRVKLGESTISETIKSKLLHSTAIAVVSYIESYNIEDLEVKLKEILLKDTFIKHIENSQSVSFKVKLLYLQKIKYLTEDKFINLVYNNLTNLNQNDAVNIGNLIDKYEWKSATLFIRDYKCHSILNSTWNLCKHHYNWFDFDNSYKILNKNTNDRPMKKIFISYSSIDRKLREIFYQKLSIHLKSAKNKFNDIWTDKEIPVGEDWNTVIQDALQSTDIGILLVSPMFLGSNYSMGNELHAMLKKRMEEGYIIFPILLSECNFQNNEILKSIQFFKTYKSEYQINDYLEKDKLMPFDELVDISKDILTNKYFLKLANEIDRAINCP